MNGFKRVMLLMVCGGLMALAALAGQIGYGDNYGQATLRSDTKDASAADRVLASDRTAASLDRPATEKL